MSIDLTNPSEVKVGLLSKGVDCNDDLFTHYDGEFYENVYVYGNTNVVEKRHRFPQVLLLGNGVVSAFLRREGSPWNLRLENKSRFALYHEERYVQYVALPEKPAYFGKRLS